MKKRLAMVVAFAVLGGCSQINPMLEWANLRATTTDTANSTQNRSAAQAPVPAYTAAVTSASVEIPQRVADRPTNLRTRSTVTSPAPTTDLATPVSVAAAAASNNDMASSARGAFIACENIDFDALIANGRLDTLPADQVAKCIDDPVIGYNYATALFNNGFIEQGLAQLRQLGERFPNDERVRDVSSLESSEIIRRMDSPFTYAAEIANSKLEQWLSRPSEVTPFTLPIPKRMPPPEIPVLIKGEFETTAAFDTRRKEAEERYKQEIARIEEQYQTSVKEYNEAVEKHNAALRWEYRARKERAELMRWRFLSTALKEVLGTPFIDNLRYDADTQTFLATLFSTDSNFSTPIEIHVPLNEAPALRQNASLSKPILEFKMDNGHVTIGDIKIEFDGKLYQAYLTDRIFDRARTREIIGLDTVKDYADRRLLSPQQLRSVDSLNTNPLVRENRSFFERSVDGPAPSNLVQ